MSKSKKNGSKHLKNFLAEIYKKDFNLQKTILHDNLTKCMNNHEQVNDVLFMGSRLH